MSALFALMALWAQDPLPAPVPEVAPAAPSGPEGYCTPRRLALVLEELATKHPDLVRVESLGRSASGLEIPLVTLALLEGDSPRSRPAVLLVAAFGSEDLFGTELALALVRQCVAEAHHEGPVRQLLGRVAVYVVPALHPDVRSQALAGLESGMLASAPRRVELDSNFPAGWDPLAEAGAGPYPLSEPESRALAEFLVANPNVSACLRLVPPSLERPLAVSWPAADVRAQSEWFEGLGAGGLELAARSPGSFLRFAYEERGAFVLALPCSFERGGPLALPRIGDIPRLSREALAGVLHAARALPTLSFCAPTVGALGPAQWSLDIAVTNSGALPTASARARELELLTMPELVVHGARVVAAASIVEGESKSMPVRGSKVTLAELGGGERVGVRLFLSAASATDVRIEVRSARAGSASVAARLE
ncbi:MAG: hypothetical protein FJ294_02005 [Planctomycetes bacterium]|nr:hypothetical protein [Planctomycetota bacterium]